MFQVKYNFVDHIHPKNIFKFAYFSARPVLTSHWPALDYSKEHGHPRFPMTFLDSLDIDLLESAIAFLANHVCGYGAIQTNERGSLVSIDSQKFQ